MSDNLYSLIVAGSSCGTLSSINVMTLLLCPSTYVLWLWAWGRPFFHQWTQPRYVVLFLQMVSCWAPQCWSRNASQDFAASSRAEEVCVCPQLCFFPHLYRLLNPVPHPDPLWNALCLQHGHSSVISPEPCVCCKLHISLQFMLKVVIGEPRAWLEVFPLLCFLKWN